MMRTLLLITSPPGSTEARRALELAESMRTGGVGVALVLLQDAVLASLGNSRTPAGSAAHALVGNGVSVYVAEADLTLRGFSSANLIPGVTPADDRRIVDLMLADGTRVLGCF